jgi:hypothetical protein
MNPGGLAGGSKDLEDVLGAVRECVTRGVADVSSFALPSGDPGSVAVDQTANETLAKVFDDT